MELSAQDKLKIYENLLHKWQPKINLISSKTLINSAERHFEDSAQIEQLIPKEAKSLFDLGSGGGFPGMVLAIVRPDLKVHLVESDTKKCVFLKTVSRETQTPVEVHNERIENVSCETIPDVITARALASLVELFQYCEGWIRANPAAILIFPKGARSEEELEILKKSWNYKCCTHNSKTEESAKILVFSEITRL